MKAAIITISDKGSRGERADTSGPALAAMLRENGYEIVYSAIVPDETVQIQEQLIKCCDELKLELVLTSGGTGFTRRDITPEATGAVIERFTPGISEFMRMESAKVTANGILSRGVSGIRGDTLIVNLPGSEKAARECLGFILPALNHAFRMLGVDSAEH
jgi:molybdenum cofactor synthesis domain-containing protein